MEGRVRLLLASDNVGKISEFKALLRGLGWLELVTPRQLGVELCVLESGATLAENAVRKALAYWRATRMPVLADDSGLEVDALGGFPGVQSARWEGPDDAARIDGLLTRLLQRGQNRLGQADEGGRSARFRCSLALVSARGEVFTAEGTCEGEIVDEPRGSHGFGYDPIFLVPEYGLTLAELSPDEKNRISHRARAMTVLRPVLLRELSPQGTP
jgi:XTP/dITP diphosphohydrolase